MLHMQRMVQTRCVVQGPERRDWVTASENGVTAGQKCSARPARGGLPRFARSEHVDGSKVLLDAPFLFLSSTEIRAEEMHQPRKTAVNKHLRLQNLLAADVANALPMSAFLTIFPTGSELLPANRTLLLHIQPVSSISDITHKLDILRFSFKVLIMQKHEWMNSFEVAET